MPQIPLQRRFWLVAAVATALASSGCSSKLGAKQPAPARVAIPGKPAAVAASTPPVPTCKTVAATPPSGPCEMFEKAPRADASTAQHVLEIWTRLESPFQALTGRESTLVVLGPDARMGEGASAKPVKPAAYICPGTPPKVYVPDSLIKLVDNADPKKYPDDFLAFVIGHELGHRMNDLTVDGCQLSEFQRPDQEELADARSAFFIASAGFSASKIARADLVSRFLQGEYDLGREITQTRRDSLLGALQQFDGYEALYQAGLTVALTGGIDEADRVLTWADELVQSRGVLLPELRVARAIVRINAVAKDQAPWGFDLRLPLDKVRCTPLHPGHSGLWEAPEPGRDEGGGAPPTGEDPIERNRRLLREALVLLDQAETLGATPFTVATARTCASLYLADAPAAAAAQARADALVPIRANAEISKVLASNRSLVTFLGFATKKPVPKWRAGVASRQAWIDEARTALGTIASPELAWVLAAMRGETDADLPTITPPMPASCTDVDVQRAVLWSWMRPFAEFPSLQHGSCPASAWPTLAQTLSSDDKATGTKQSITVCRGDRTAGTLVTLRVIAVDPEQPPATPPGDEIGVLIMPAPPALRDIGTWRCSCGRFERQGVSDSGQVVYDAECPGLRLGNVMIVARDGHVEDVVEYSLPKRERKLRRVRVSD